MTDTTTVDPAAIGEVVDCVVADIAASAGLQMIHLGIRTGLWKAMAGAGVLTADEVAERADVFAPYAREWLKHQAASRYITYDETTERFELPAAVAAVLADDSQSGLVEGFATMLATMGGDSSRVEEAFRTGGGVGWHQRGAAHWHGMDMATRAAVVPSLVSEWLPALSSVDRRLRRGGRVADVGCGFGAALIALARAYPASEFSGFDYHDGSIAHARRAAADAGVADRTTFEVATATEFPGAGYDLILMVDTLHDLGDPVAALRHARQVLSDDGLVLLVEFAAADRLEHNLNPWGRLLFASSALVCTPNAISQGATDSLGTAPGEARLVDVAVEAGFRRVRRVDATSPTNLLLELRP